MFGLSTVGIIVVVAVSVLTAAFAADWCLNRNRYCFGISTFCAAAVLGVVFMIAVDIRCDVLDDYKKTMPFKNPLMVTNSTEDALLVKVRAETMCVSKTFEAVLQPGDVTCFSSSTSGYCVLNVLKHDGGKLDGKYEKLVSEEEMER